MVNLLHDVDRKTPEEFNVIIECPKGSRVKYEVDKETNLVCFDRVLYSPMHYSTNYGYVPQTHWDDGDPLDVMVMSEEPLFPGILVKCRPIAKLEMIDGGDSDVKILAVPVKDPRFAEIQDMADVTPHLLAEIKHFFETYKDLQKKKVEVGDWMDKAAAIVDIKKSFELYDSMEK